MQNVAPVLNGKGQQHQRIWCRDVNSLRSLRVSPARSCGLSDRSARATNEATSSIRSVVTPHLTNSGVPNRKPFMSPFTGSIGRPIPQAKKPAFRNLLDAVCPPPKSLASSANWCDWVNPLLLAKTDNPSLFRASANA